MAGAAWDRALHGWNEHGALEDLQMLAMILKSDGRVTPASAADVVDPELVKIADALEGLIEREKAHSGRRAQSDSLATSAPKLEREEEWIDWTESADAVCQRVRDLGAEPGARTRFRGRVLKVLRARPTVGLGAPGTVVVVRFVLAVAAGRGAVVLEEVFPEGDRRMTGEEFARMHGVKLGEALV